MDNKRFCSVGDIQTLVIKSTGKAIDPIYFNAIADLMQLKGDLVNFEISDNEMDFKSFLVFTNLLNSWYNIQISDMADFIEQKFREKYSVTSADLLNVLLGAVENRPAETALIEKEPIDVPSEEYSIQEVVSEVKSKGKKRGRKPRKSSLEKEEKDLYKLVQSSLKKGMTRQAILKKYNLTQQELTQYEGFKYWSQGQKADHLAMLEYRRTHPDCTNSEAIEKGAKKPICGYRFALVPTQEQQQAYNNKIAAKEAKKTEQFKSIPLSESEEEEKKYIDNKIREIAVTNRIPPRDVETMLKMRLTKDYGIVINQVKKDLMLKYDIHRGEGKAPNAIEAIVMSEYSSLAKSILEDMSNEV